MTSVAFLILTLVAQAAPGPERKTSELHQDDVQLVGRYQLKPNHGGYSWHGDGFTAAVAVDGSVHFEEDVRLPGEATVPVVAVAQAVKGINPTSRSAGTPPRNKDYAPATGSSPSGGLVSALGRAATKMVTHPTLVVSDEELRHDSHHAAKMSFLEGTAKFREGLRAAWERKTNSGALGRLRTMVRTIAADESKPLAERHRLVFSLWDECDDSAGGVAARTTIEEEAGRQFPSGGVRGFTAAELAKLNAGQRRPFSPYRADAVPARSP
jgi:hypothetical protein